MQVERIPQGVLLRGVDDFYSAHIFECGQAFRWDWDDVGYVGVVYDKVVRVIQQANNIIIENATMEDYELIWKNYFDLETDYNVIKRELSKDPVMADSIQFGWGMRILNQDPWETLISFIISANNGVTRIKKIVANLAQKYGTKILWNGNEYYIFPTASALAESSIDDLYSCGCGYRAPYIHKTAKMVADGDINLDELLYSSYDKAFSELLRCSGVGPKVADCILLFSLKKGQAFPVDVWIKRIMEYFYFNHDVSPKKLKEYAIEKFGNIAGVAQQYLFYYARENKIGR